MAFFGLFGEKKQEKEEKKQWGRANIAEDSELGVKVRLAKADLTQRKLELEMQQTELDYQRKRLMAELDMERMRQELDDLRAEYEEEAPEGAGPEDTMLTTLLTAILSGRQQQGQQTLTPPAPASHAPKSEITDEEIQQFWNAQNGLVQKAILGMTDAQIQAEITHRMPNLSTDSMARIHSFIDRQKV